MKQEALLGVRTLLSPSDFSGRAAGSPKLVLIQAIAAGHSTIHRAQASPPRLHRPDPGRVEAQTSPAMTSPSQLTSNRTAKSP